MIKFLIARENRTALIAFLAFAGLGISAGLLGIAWTPMQIQFEQPLDGLNILFFVQTFSYTIIAFYISRIMARFGSFFTLMSGTALIVLSLVGIAVAPIWQAVIFASIIAGLGTGFLDAGLNLYMASYHTEQQMNFLHASFGIGITAGPLLMNEVLRQKLGWQIGYAVSAVLVMFVLFAFLLTRRRWQTIKFQSANQEVVERAPFMETLKVPNVWLSMLIYVAYVGIEISIGQWLYTILEKSRGFDPSIAGFWVSVYWGALTISRIVFSFIVNRFKLVTLVRACMIGIVVGAWLFLWNPSIEIAFLGIAIIGIAQGPVFATLMSSTADRVGARHAANCISMQITGSGLGTMIIPGLIGTIGKVYGFEMMAVTFLVMAGIMFGTYEILVRFTYHATKS